MASYWLSFRIDQNGTQRSADQRRKMLYAEVAKMDPKAWVDTTSFIIFNSDKTIDAIANVVKLLILPKLDTVLIRQLGAAEARAIGNHANLENLKRYMDYVEVK